MARLKCWKKFNYLDGYVRKDESGLIIIERDNPKGNIIPDRDEKLQVTVSENNIVKRIGRRLTKKQANNLVKSYMRRHDRC